MTISMTIGQIGQLVGFVAAAVVAASFQCRRERTIALFWTVSSALFVVHYALLGQLSGAVMQVPLLLRNLLVLSRRPWVLLVLIGGAVAAFVGGCVFPVPADRAGGIHAGLMERPGGSHPAHPAAGDFTGVDDLQYFCAVLGRHFV